MNVNTPVYDPGACAAGTATLIVISCEYNVNPELFALATKVIELPRFAHVGAAVGAAPDHARTVPV